MKNVLIISFGMVVLIIWVTVQIAVHTDPDPERRIAVRECLAGANTPDPDSPFSKGVRQRAVMAICMNRKGYVFHGNGDCDMNRAACWRKRG